MMKPVLKKWSQITLQTQLIIISTLFVSLIMSSLSFWGLNSIKQETTITDQNFVQDLTLLLTKNVIPLIEEGLYENLVSLSEGFYNSTSSIRYIIYLDDEGEIYYSIPLMTPGDHIFFNTQALSLKGLNILENPKNLKDSPDFTTVLLDLYSDSRPIGFLVFGVNPNPTIVNSSRLTIHLSITIFFSVWLIVIFGAAFNTLSCYKIVCICIYENR